MLIEDNNKSKTGKNNGIDDESSSLLPSSYMKEQISTANRFAKSFAKEQQKLNANKDKNLVVVLSWKDITTLEYLGDSGGQFSSYYRVKITTSSRNRDAPNNNNKTRRRERDHPHRHHHPSDDDTEDGDDDVQHHNKYYTLKCLNVPIMTRSSKDDGTTSSSNMIYERFVNASIDFLYEAVLLSKLNHENIVQLQGVSSGNLITDRFKLHQQQGHHHGTHHHDDLGYFFLIDSIQSETLHQRLVKWKFTTQRYERQRQLLPFKGRLLSKLSLIMPSSHSNNTVKDVVTPPPSIYHRVKHILLGIATAMEYLHSHNIVVRELRPDIIGFDSITGQVKLFDLSSACRYDEIIQQQQDEDDDDVDSDGVTARKGVSSSSSSAMICNMISTWYKSPEYLLSNVRTYDLSTDVYSFAMIMYHVLTLHVPFQSQYKHHITLYKKNVLLKGERPSLNNFVESTPISASSSSSLTSSYSEQQQRMIIILKRLLQQCWDPIPTKRPTFHRIVEQLKYLVNDVDGSDDVDDYDLPSLMSSTSNNSHSH